MNREVFFIRYGSMFLPATNLRFLTTDKGIFNLTFCAYDSVGAYSGSLKLILTNLHGYKKIQESEL